MNDDELNQMLSRDEEASTFRDLDIVKEHFAFGHWWAAGHRGKPPQQLMQLGEQPKCYQIDEPLEVEGCG